MRSPMATPTPAPTAPTAPAESAMPPKPAVSGDPTPPASPPPTEPAAPAPAESGAPADATMPGLHSPYRPDFTPRIKAPDAFQDAPITRRPRTNAVPDAVVRRYETVGEEGRGFDHPDIAASANAIGQTLRHPIQTAREVGDTVGAGISAAKAKAGVAAGKIGDAVGSARDKLRDFFGLPAADAGQPKFGGPNDDAPKMGKLVSWTDGGAKMPTPKELDETEQFVRQQYGPQAPGEVAKRRQVAAAMPDGPQKRSMVYTLDRLATRIAKPPKDAGPVSPERMAERQQEHATVVREQFGEHAEKEIQSALDGIQDNEPNAEGRRAYLTGVLEHLGHEKAGVSVDTTPTTKFTGDPAAAREHLAAGGTVSIQTGHGAVPVESIDEQGRASAGGKRYAIGRANNQFALGSLPAKTGGEGPGVRGEGEGAGNETELGQGTDVEPKPETKAAGGEAKAPEGETAKPLESPPAAVTEPLEKPNLAEATHATKTPAFKAWAGDWEQDPAKATKVVGQDGAPIPVFHGTSNGTHTVFDPKKSSKENLFGPGAGYFTENPTVADTYQDKGKNEWKLKVPRQQVYDDAYRALDAKTKTNITQQDRDAFGALSSLREGQPITNRISRALEHALPPEKFDAYVDEPDPSHPKRYETYLNIRQPFDVDKKYTPDEARGVVDRALAGIDSKKADRLRERIVTETNPEAGERIDPNRTYPGDHVWRTIANATDPEIANKLLKRAGYDGITHIGGGRAGGGETMHRVWIPFDSTQVKSTDNRGTFDPKDPDIRHIFGWGGPKATDAPAGPNAQPEQPPRQYAGQEFHQGDEPIGTKQLAALSPHHVKVAEAMNQAAQKANLPEETKRDYIASNNRILSNATPETAQLFAKSPGKHVAFPDAESMNQHLATNNAQIAKANAEGRMAGGAYHYGTDTVTSDGHVDSEGAPTSLHRDQIVSHELGHKWMNLLGKQELPGGVRFSAYVHPDWEAIHKQEMTDGKLTNYATTDAHESFAEAFAAIHSGQVSPDVFRKEFPKAAEFFETHGLIPKAAADGMSRHVAADGGAGPMQSPLAKPMAGPEPAVPMKSPMAGAEKPMFGLGGGKKESPSEFETNLAEALKKPAKAGPRGYPIVKVGDKEYMVKRGNRYSESEKIGSDLAKVAGVNVVPVESGGKNTNAVEWTPGLKTIVDMPQNERIKAVQALPHHEAESHALFDYLLGYTDPHEANYAIKDGHLIGMDKDPALSAGTIGKGIQFHIPDHLRFLGGEHFELSGDGIGKMIAAGDKMAASLEDQGKSKDAIGVRNRTQALRQLAEQHPKSATVGDLRRLAERGLTKRG